jgi:hypothetical protein
VSRTAHRRPSSQHARSTSGRRRRRRGCARDDLRRLRDQASGLFFDLARMHTLARKGDCLSVRRPLNVARPVQGWPKARSESSKRERNQETKMETGRSVFESLEEKA